MSYKIFYEKRFKNDLKEILNYIKKDKIISTQNFQKELKQKNFFPYKFRKSIYFDDENIRDLIYRCYVIPYKIDKNNIYLRYHQIQRYFLRSNHFNRR